MIGSLINRLLNPNSVSRDGDSMLLTLTDFNREISRERIRATRRSIPFCIVTIELIGRKQLRLRRRSVIRLLHRNVRLTDQKADLGSNRFGFLSVDTSEMGGRAVLDRLSELCDARGINAKLTLRVHDPEGFDLEQTRHLPTGSGTSRSDDGRGPQWIRIDESSPSASALTTVLQPSRQSERAGMSEVRSTRATSTNTCIISDDTLVEKPLAARVIKRAVDVVGASLGLVLTSPLIIVGAVAVKLTSPGPALFKQTREGMRGKSFTIYKMRTMVVDAESKQSALVKDSHRDGPAFKVKGDPRVTRIGHFLRITCIDELPQFVNVLRGEMSLVGPRPLPWHESRACHVWHRRRLDVPPGLTCYWQVDKAAAETFDDWMRMDLRYVDHNSLWQYLRLIARTVLVPISGRGGE